MSFIVSEDYKCSTFSNPTAECRIGNVSAFLYLYCRLIITALHFTQSQSLPFTTYLSCLILQLIECSFLWPAVHNVIWWKYCKLCHICRSQCWPRVCVYVCLFIVCVVFVCACLLLSGYAWQPWFPAAAAQHVQTAQKAAEAAESYQFVLHVSMIKWLLFIVQMLRITVSFFSF